MKLSNYSKIFKALSNEQRLKIFLTLYNECCESEGKGEAAQAKAKAGSCCVLGALEKAFTKICSCVNLSRSTISHHFKELQAAGLITCERAGQTYRCRINEDVVDSIKNFLK